MPPQAWPLYASRLLNIVIYLPHYSAPLCGVRVLHQLFLGNVWHHNNKLLLQNIGNLLIIDVLRPSLVNLLQVMAPATNKKYAVCNRLSCQLRIGAFADRRLCIPGD